MEVVVAFLIIFFIFVLLCYSALEDNSFYARNRSNAYWQRRYNPHNGSKMSCKECYQTINSCSCAKNDSGLVVVRNRYYKASSHPMIDEAVRGKIGKVMDFHSSNRLKVWFAVVRNWGTSQVPLWINDLEAEIPFAQLPSSIYNALNLSSTVGEYQPGFVHCMDTGKYEPKVNCIWNKSSRGWSIVRTYGKDDKRFILWHTDKYSYVRIYAKNEKGELDENKWEATYTLKGEITPVFASDFLATKILTGSEVKQRGISMPFKARIKWKLLAPKEFDGKYKPNVQALTRYESSKADTSLNSLGEIVDEITEIVEVEARTLPSCNRAINEWIVNARRKAEQDNGGVEVYAVWYNFDIDTGMFCMDEYDNLGPAHYYFNRFASKKDLVASPM